MLPSESVATAVSTVVVFACDLRLVDAVSVTIGKLLASAAERRPREVPPRSIIA